MWMPLRGAACVIALLVTWQTAQAQATMEGAQELRSTLERYLGRPKPGQPGSVAVEPAGESYRVTIDLKQLAGPLERFGFTLDAPPLSFDTTPQPDGKWRVHNWAEPGPATILFAGQTHRYFWEGVQFDGTFDPAIGLFSRFDQRIARRLEGFDGPTEEGTTEYSELVTHSTAVAALGGGADGTGRQTYGPIKGRQTIMTPPAENQPPAPWFELDYDLASAVVDVRMEGLQARRMLDLWAESLEAVAGEGLVAENARWEALIRKAIPVFRKMEQNGSLQRLQVRTGIGNFGLEQMGTRWTTTGLVPDGSMSLSFNASGFTFPASALPAWSVGLVPTAMDLNFGVSGYDLQSVVLQTVSKIQLDRSPMLAPQDWQHVFSGAATERGISVSIVPSRLTGPLFDLNLKGAVVFKGFRPIGKIEVLARGLPRVLEALQQAQGDPVAGQALASLSAAQALGRPGPDGQTMWEIELPPTGGVLVNGTMVSPSAQ